MKLIAQTFAGEKKVTNEKITSELEIVKNVNTNLKNRIINLEKLRANAEQYNNRKNVEILEILNKIPGKDLENNVNKICRNSDIIIRY